VPCRITARRKPRVSRTGPCVHLTGQSVLGSQEHLQTCGLNRQIEWVELHVVLRAACCAIVGFHIARTD
jgi:hypothetical protein